MASTLVAAGVIAFLAALAIVRLAWSQGLARLVVDIPNERSLHDVPTPRTGGIGLMIAAALAWVLTANGALTGIATLAAALAALFLIDDVRGLAVTVRFVAQLAAAVAFIAMDVPQPLWLAPVLAVGIVWATNLYNFMDGSNGLAGGMTVTGFSAYALAAGAAGVGDVAVVAVIVAAAGAGFLVWNFDPARIFLGDAGSIPIGFLAAAIGIHGWQREVWPFWLPLLVFSPFVLDATVTLLRRWRRGERLSEAHKSHYYQRLVRMGWSHRRLALAAYALMAAAGATAVVMRPATRYDVAVVLVAWLAIYGWIALTIDRRWAAFEARQRQMATAAP